MYIYIFDFFPKSYPNIILVGKIVGGFFEKPGFKLAGFLWDIINKNSRMSLRKGRGSPVHLAQYQYEVHASNISDMSLVISRTRIHPETIPQPSRQSINPYVFKPKSYSTKKIPPQDIVQKLPRASPSKKIKRQNSSSKDPNSQLIFQLDQINKQIEKGYQNYFSDSFFSKGSFQTQKNSSSYLRCLDDFAEKKLNPMMKNEITIVSNKNEKIQVLIHEGLLLSNTSHSKLEKDDHFLKDVVNPFDYQRRNFYLKNGKFEKDYKSGYAPIQMQQRNVEEPQEGNNNYEVSKTHFIRKKQSTLSLPRSCGVSYIKPTQSTQEHPFEPLPPLIFQCSSRCQDNKSGETYEAISTLFNNFSQSSWIPYIQTNEDEMRDLLLGKRVGQVGWVKGIQNLWPLFTEGTFFLLLFTQSNCLTEQDVWRLYGECPFKIGVLAKKSTSGKKAFLKSLNIKESGEQQCKTEKEQKNLSEIQMTDRHSKQSLPEESKSSPLEEVIAAELKDCRTVITLSLRLQMYVEQKQWKSSTKSIKDMLNYIITNLKDALEKNLLSIIKKRFNLAKQQQRGSLLQDALSKIRIFNSKQSSHHSGKLKESTLVLNQAELTEMLKKNIKEMPSMELALFKTTKTANLQQVYKMVKSEQGWEKGLKMPLYYISTRDSFAFDLIEKTTLLKRDNGKVYKKIEYFFEADNLPTNYGKEYKDKFPNLSVGLTAYHDFFTNQQLEQFEKNTFSTEINAFKNKFLQMTVQPSIVGNKIKRTKFFFGYRYMWTRCQLAQPGSYVGAGVRKDVTSPPKWTQKIINEFIKSSIAEKDFINSIAINVYHDGKEGLAQHFDDAVRFKQPIYTLRLFSDARLSFGSQFYGFCNGAFIIPLPRGCILVMQESSYAANGVKHCVRPCDMTGKSAAVILRQMHQKVVNESKKYDELIDFPAWVSSMSSSEEAVTFAEQKRREAEYLINNPQREDSNK